MALNVPIEFALNFFAANREDALVLLAERENEAGKSGLFLFEKCMIKMLLFHVELFNTKKVAEKANLVFGSGRSKSNLRNDWFV